MIAMKRLIVLWAGLIAVALAAPAFADFATGRSAFLKNDYAMAGVQFEAAATSGDAQAMMALGTMYAAGYGVERDAARAFEWILKAAEGGHIAAQSDAARRYSVGDGVTKDDALALLWARRAADKGDADAQYIMGVRHAEGLGVKRDSGQALLWFAAAAEQGSVRAQYSAGFLLAQGAAAAKLPAHAQQLRLEAYKWLLIAEKGGAPDAARGVAALKKLLTEEQLAAGAQSAAAFKPINPYSAASQGIR